MPGSLESADTDGRLARTLSARFNLASDDLDASTALGVATDARRHRWSPSQFATYVDLRKHALEELGHPPLLVGMQWPGYVLKPDDEAAEVQWPYWAEMFDEASARERGGTRPTMETIQPEIVGAPLSKAEAVRDGRVDVGYLRRPFVQLDRGVTRSRST